MRKCLQCGAQLSDADMTCDKCGSDDISEIILKNADEKRKKGLKIIGIGAVCVLAAVAIGLGVNAFVSFYTPSRPVYEGVLAVNSGDSKAYLAQMHESFSGEFEDTFESQYGGTEQYDSEWKQNLEQNFGKDYKVSVSVLDVAPMSDTMVAAMNSTYSESHGTVFEAVKYVTVKTVITGENGLESVNTQLINSVLIDGKWYLFEDIKSGGNQ